MKELVFYEVFLYLQRAYNALDRDRCLDILVEYGVGLRALRLLRTYWGRITMLSRAEGYYGPPFKVYHGVTQGDPLSPTLSNLVMDAAIRHWVMVVAETEVVTEELGLLIQELVAYFYSDDSILASMRSEILQREFKALAELFKRVELFTNMGNTVSMDCQHFCAIGGHYTEAYGLHIMGEGMTHQVKLHQRVRCPGCDMYLEVGLLATQLRVKHRVGS